MSNNLKLYGVRCVSTGETVRVQGIPVYFSSKYAAKQRRNDLAAETGEAFAVILGPDHYKNSTSSPSVVGSELGL